MVVDKRTVLNENRERVHVRWTTKRGNEIDLSIECGVTPRSFPGVSQNMFTGEPSSKSGHEKGPCTLKDTLT